MFIVVCARCRSGRNEVIYITFTVFAILFAAMGGACTSATRDTPPTDRCMGVKSAAAVFEWLVALVFVGYLITLVIDLRMQEADAVIAQHFYERNYNNNKPKLDAAGLPVAAGAPGVAAPATEMANMPVSGSAAV